MAGSIYQWSKTPSDNGNADTDVPWPEGMARRQVNDSARAMMARVAELRDDVSGTLTAGGTANALTITANSGFTTYANGRMLTFIAAAGNTGAATLNVNSIGAKAIRRMSATGDVALDAGDLVTDGRYKVIYSTAANGGSGAWLLDWPNKRIDYVPVGTVQDFAGSTAPSGWLLCYGQAISRTTYAALFAVIGTGFGVGDGSTTFNLPDLRGRVIAGKDNMGGTSADRLTNQSGGLDGDTLGASGGSETHTLTVGQMPEHRHTGTTGSPNQDHTHTYLRVNSQSIFYQPGGAGGVGLNPSQQEISTSTAGASTNHTHDYVTSYQGSSQAHNNVQPTIILNKIIFAGV